ncbi:OmpA family protein [Sporosalibacterium faouarense]|uniref:OmpA family protein n=1 Tax=Sporosalibacterium faouarense TaxID=516123 RepID=UPI00141C9F42|nr:OmpA family protein [Sporosalibacterium faouarense]MTI48919.1 flagellar motor protein MotB [Bacillota bacterium]
MKARKRRFQKNGEAQNFWPSFTDMISTIALILFFLMILAYVQNMVTGSNLDYAKQQLEDTQDHLDNTLGQLQDTQQRLEESNSEISRAEKNLQLLEDKIDKVRAEVERGEDALKLSEQKIEDQKEIIAESNQELGRLRSKLEGIALLRLDVLTKVKDSIEEELSKNRDNDQDLVYIADNGNIIIDEGLVFDFNSAEIKNEGRDLLDELAVAFENVLDESDVRENIDAISIQGHADSNGTAEHNRELSSLRSVSVVDYLLNANSQLEDKYASYFVASGYSEFRPIASNNTEEGRAKNRRIEISVILKDSNIRNILDDYLEDSMDVFDDN